MSRAELTTAAVLDAMLTPLHPPSKMDAGARERAQSFLRLTAAQRGMTNLDLRRKVADEIRAARFETQID